MVFRLQIALDRVASPTRAGPGLPGEWSPNGCSKVKVEGDQAVVRAPGIKKSGDTASFNVSSKTHFYTKYDGPFPNYLLSVYFS